MKCAVIGLGAMGLPMARRLVEAGHQVTGYDVAAERRALLAKLGGEPADTAADAAEGAALALVMVLSAAQARDVVPAIAGRMATGGVVVLGSTVSPEDARAIAALAPHLGFVDAPVSGGVAGAEGGKLAIMASGSADAMERARPALEPLGRVFDCGREVGKGSLVKAVNQLLCAVHIAAAAEAFAFARSSGIDPALLMDVMSAGAANSSMFQTRVPRMRDNDFTTKSAVELFTKDLAIVLEATRQAGTPAFLAQTALQVFQMAMRRGLGKSDDSSLVQVYEQPKEPLR